MIKSQLFRIQSGINEDLPNTENYKMIRSVVMNEHGKLKIKEFINEIFTGLLDASWGKIEYYGFPSTLLVDNQTVVMASQIYDREFTKDNKSGIYKDIKTYEKYFEKRIQRGAPKITWLGAPSIVFSYKNRNELKPYLNNSNVINLMFWITSFNSTTCISEFSNSTRDETDKLILYCDKYQDLKKFCKKWQIHNTYLNYYLNNVRKNPTEEELQGKFLTNFDSCFRRIQDEDYYLRLYNNEKNTDFYQRYNEMFTYYYPWDIEGLEIGNVEESELLKLLHEIHVQRKKTIDELYLIIEDDTIIDKINMVIDIFKKDDYQEIILTKISTFEINYTLFLIVKIIVLSECNLQERYIGRNFDLNQSDKENIRELITIIITIMKRPIKLYEYQLNYNSIDDKGFTMQEVGFYDDSVTSIKRKSPFVLFEQNLDENTKITNISISNKQLITNEQLTNDHLINDQEEQYWIPGHSGGRKKSSRKKSSRKKSSRKKSSKKNIKVKYNA